MNIITVKINGIEYNLKGDEKEEYLHMVASYIDKKLKTITTNNSKLSTTSAAVLTAVNIADEMFKCNDKYSALEDKAKELEEKNDKLQQEIEDLKRELNELKTRKVYAVKNENEETEALKKQIKDLKFELQTAKYKIISLQDKIIDDQINIAKIKQNNNPLLKVDK